GRREIPHLIGKARLGVLEHPFHHLAAIGKDEAPDRAVLGKGALDGLENSETRFAYQVWDFTSSSARALDHIRGEFLYEAVGANETRVTWTYAIAPRAFFVRPFVRSYLENDFAPFMESGLQGAAEAFNAERAS
ncbi:MAG: hypothetical protein AAFY97_09800, partial [Pseudomonadota bacterium]